MKSRFDQRYEEIWNQICACAGEWDVICEEVTIPGTIGNPEPMQTIQHCLMEIELEDPSEKFVVHIEFWKEENQIDFVEEYNERVRQELQDRTGDFYPRVGKEYINKRK